MPCGNALDGRQPWRSGADREPPTSGHYGEDHVAAGLQAEGSGFWLGQRHVERHDRDSAVLVNSAADGGGQHAEGLFQLAELDPHHASCRIRMDQQANYGGCRAGGPPG
jgi:hypothetical protein